MPLGLCSSRCHLLKGYGGREVRRKTNHRGNLGKSLFMVSVAMFLFITALTLAETPPPEVEWERTFGGPEWDGASSVQQTSDGGYIVAGSTRSYGAGDFDFWLVKVDPDGDLQWSKTFGGPNDEVANSVQQTTDGGYIVAGWTASYGAGWHDFWLVKVDPDGDLQWSKTFGGPLHEEAYSVQQTSDGGYIGAGYTCLLYTSPSPRD